MKILIIPNITQPRNDAVYQICSSLITILRTDHTIAISASKENRFHHISLYACPSAHKTLFLADRDQSYETYLYQSGAASLDYLRKDMDSIQYAVDHFEPDIILTMDRIAAIPVALQRNIPVISFVHSSMYTKNNVPVSSLKRINAFLKENNMEQILHLRELYRLCNCRIGFGIPSFHPYPESENITRIGSMSFLTPSKVKENQICIYLNHVPFFPMYLRHIIEETFTGAPCSVHVSYSGCKSETRGNIHYMKSPKISLLAKSSVCIHNGDDYISNICETFAIPQIIYADHSCIHRFNGFAVRRNNAGFLFSENKLSLKTMYESYRLCITDDEIRNSLADISNAIAEEGNLLSIAKLLKESSR